MENLYFPIFLVAMAVLVIWMYHKSRKAHERREDEKYQRTHGYQKNKREKRQTPIARSGARPAAVVGSQTSNQMWAGRHQRASHNSLKAKDEEDLRAIQATYIKPDVDDSVSEQVYGRLREQEVSELDYVGFDEYISRQRKAASQEGAAEELTMTAVKYEPSDVDAAEEDNAEIRRAGFKP